MQVEPAGEAPRNDGEREGGRRRRRRGRGRGRGGEPREPREGTPHFARVTAPEHTVAHEDRDGGSPEEVGPDQQPSQDGAPTGGEGDVRRRRRRGRRGGRRNRGRNGDAPFASNGSGEPQSELQHAVEDMDRSPAPQAYEQPAMERPIIDRPYNQPPVSAPEPQPAPPPQAAAPAPPESKPPRRRSTIREPAPIAIAGAPPPPAPVIPPPTPVVSSTASEDSGQPKRGWWAKRLLGDKG